jgi:NodT family efflux transporter outer membrane factor (OMF) lipoprotein
MTHRPLLIALTLLLSACATSRPPAPAAQVDAPPSWRAAVPAGENVRADWWQSFGDPLLVAVVERALAGNTDLAVAEARVREAEALAVQARAGLLPTLDATVSAQNARSAGSSGRTSTTQAQLQASYEVDLWGRVRAANDAARASLQASRYGRDAAALSVSAATVQAYVQLLSLDAQLDIARDTLVSRDKALHAAKRRAETGYTSRLELAQAEAEQRGAAQNVPAFELAVRQQENAVRLLTGDAPGPVERGRLAALRLPILAPGLPSTLLARRPDVAEAEAQLAAADAGWASDRAALLPQVALTGSVGRLFVEHLDPVTVWSLGGSLLAPLFDGGRRAAQADATEARRDQSAWSYRGVVLNAFAETENALEAIARLEMQAVEVNARREALAEALKHARSRYLAGYASYLEELDAQRGLYGAEQAQVQLQESRLLNAVALYQALGGGWTRSAE